MQSLFELVIRTWWTYLEITEEYKLPSLEACSDSQIHVLYCGSIFPTSGLIESRYPPDTGGPCMTKRETQKNYVDSVLRFPFKLVNSSIDLFVVHVTAETAGRHAMFLFLKHFGYVSTVWRDQRGRGAHHWIRRKHVWRIPLPAPLRSGNPVTFLGSLSSNIHLSSLQKWT